MVILESEDMGIPDMQWASSRGGCLQTLLRRGDGVDDFYSSLKQRLLLGASYSLYGEEADLNLLQQTRVGRQHMVDEARAYVKK